MAADLQKALGSVLGAFVGDSLGSYIEFERDISEAKLMHTLRMLGGGPFDVGPGQVTDDSELAMCLIRGLLDGRGVFNLDLVAGYYKQWVRTPFDIGITTRNALYPLSRQREAQAMTAINAALHSNQRSLSNGSVMRCTPLAVYLHKLDDAQVFQAVMLESSMTHSNPLVHQIESCYVKAIIHLLNHPGDNSGAYAAARRMGEQFGSADCMSWLHDVENSPPMIGTKHEGYVKIAFDHAFRHLIRGSDFETAMSETLALGGDTDTNACIVGGMIGALVGFDGILPQWTEKVMNFTHGKHGGRKRPEFLDQTVVRDQVIELFNLAPTSLSIEPQELLSILPKS